MVRNEEPKWQTKLHMRQVLIRLGLWYSLNLVRKVPGILGWLRSGCRGSPPHPIKLMIVGSYLRQFSIAHFVETGTYLGETLGYVAQQGVRSTSIEIGTELYQAACKRFKRYENVRLVQGDSAQKLPEVLKEIERPTLFWLDGHYCVGISARAESQTPILAEVESILYHPIKKHVVLIDDARLFDGSNDYSYLDDLLRLIRQDGNYTAEVSADIVRLVPSRPES